MKLRIAFLFATLLFCAACVKELPAESGKKYSSAVTITASLPADESDAKVEFAERPDNHNLAGSWKQGDKMVGLVCGAGPISFDVVSVDAQGRAVLMTESTALAEGSVVNALYFPGKTEADIASGSMAVDFSSQAADVVPALMTAKAVVKKSGSSLSLNLSFKSAVAILGVCDPKLSTMTSRTVTSLTLSGPEIISSGTVKLQDDSLVFVPGAPSKFITKQLNLPVASGTIATPVYVALPECKVERVTFNTGLHIYSYLAGKSASRGRYCRISGRDFTEISQPQRCGVKLGNVAWASANFNLSGGDNSGDAVKWADNKLIYSSNTGSSFVFKTGYEAGFANMENEAYYQSSAYAKYNGTDGNTVLDPVDDIVQLSYPGSGWRMPSLADFNALLDAVSAGTLTPAYSAAATVLTASDGKTLSLDRSTVKTGDGTSMTKTGKYWTSTVSGEGSNPYKVASYFRLNSSAAPTVSVAYRRLGYAIRPVNGLDPGTDPKEEDDEPDLPNYNKGKSVASLPDWTAISINYTNLTAANHPRLFLRKKDFKKIKTQTGASSNVYLTKIHNQIISAANELSKDKYRAPDRALSYTLDASGLRILQTSRKANQRIIDLAYAYRITGDEKYLSMAEFNLNSVCSFPDWHPSHFLDVGEMAVAVAVGYDWLYNDISDTLRAKAQKALKEYALQAGKDRSIWGRGGNWNQVCNGGLICAALALYEEEPSLCDEMIRRCLASNAREVKNIYAPDGAFPEGPGYWEYGTTYQGVLNLALETALGTDFELPSIEGFSPTGRYYEFIRGNSGKRFNYSDSGEDDELSFGLWYVAYQKKDASYLYHDLKYLDNDGYRSEYYSYLAATCAYKLGNVTSQPTSGRYFKAAGANPVFMCRTGSDSSDLYLALKGGCPNVSHSHLDIGEVVFDAFGTRWFKDFTYSTNYTELENLFAYNGLTTDDLGSREYESWRWKVFQYQNRNHSTMTLNDHNQWPYGMGSIYEVIDADGRLGASVDLLSAYYQDIQGANRRAEIVDGSYLEIRDQFKTKDDGKTVHVRWTCASDAVPEIVSGGIVLTDKNGVQMKLTTDAPSAQYKIWSADPADYESPFKKTATIKEDPLEGYLCGFEFDLPANKFTEIYTTLKKVQ